MVSNHIVSIEVAAVLPLSVGCVVKGDGARAKGGLAVGRVGRLRGKREEGALRAGLGSDRVCGGAGSLCSGAHLDRGAEVAILKEVHALLSGVQPDIGVGGGVGERAGSRGIVRRVGGGQVARVVLGVGEVGVETDTGVAWRGDERNTQGGDEGMLGSW